MIDVVEVKTRKQRKAFLNFPLDLYAGNPCFVPPLYMDERKIFRKDYVYNDCCDAVCFLALRDGKPVGRIQGIVQKAYNEKNGERRARFTRYDVIDDPEVSRALFEAVENWAREKGMDTLCGPLGFSDLEREGLMVEGFDQIATFEENYNAPYYAAHLESLGFTKETDWTGSLLYGAESDETMAEMEQLKISSSAVTSCTWVLRKTLRISSAAMPTASLPCWTSPTKTCMGPFPSRKG